MGFFRQSETIWPLGCQGLTVVPRRRLPSQDSRCIKNRVRDVWSTFVTIAVACDGAFLRVWSALSSSFIRLNPFAKNLLYRLSAISSRRLRGEWGLGLGWGGRWRIIPRSLILFPTTSLNLSRLPLSLLNVESHSSPFIRN